MRVPFYGITIGKTSHLSIMFIGDLQAKVAIEHGIAVVI